VDFFLVAWKAALDSYHQPGTTTNTGKQPKHTSHPVFIFFLLLKWGQETVFVHMTLTRITDSFYHFSKSRDVQGRRDYGMG
jgi:hypothetical protein